MSDYAAVDTSVTANAGNHLFDQVGRLAQIQNQLNQNKLFQGQVAAGRALQQSIDPQTGQVDFGRAASLVSADPATAPFALDAMNNLLTGQGKSISNTDAKTKLQGLYNANMQQDWLSASQAGIDPHLALVRGIAMGRYPAEVAATFAGSGGVPADQLAKASAIALGPDAVRAAYGSPETQDVGGKQVTSLVNPALGTKTTMAGDAAVLDKTLTPSDAVSPAYTTFNAQTQQPEIVTKGAAAALGAGGPAGAHIPAGAPLGAEQAANTAGQGAASILNADRADANGAMQRISSLKHINDLLGTPEGKTGPGTQVINGWRNFLLAHAPAIAAMTNGGIDEAKLRSATLDELKKYMSRYAGDAASQYGQGTNEKLAVAASGNANPDMSTLANRDVTRMNLALERARQARMAAWDASGQPPQNYGQFVSSWNRTVDPRAFMLDLLSPQERGKMLSTITSDADKKALLRGKKAAESAGLFAEKDIPR